DRHRENPARPSDPHILGHRARHPQDPPGLHDRPAHHRRFMSAHPKGRHRRTGRPGRLSQPRHIPARHQALALVDATAIVTTKTPIRLIQNNFVSPNPEVGLEPRCRRGTDTVRHAVRGRGAPFRDRRSQGSPVPAIPAGRRPGPPRNSPVAASVTTRYTSENRDSFLSPKQVIINFEELFGRLVAILSSELDVNPTYW